MVLAFAAFLAVAGPAMVMAGAPVTSYQSPLFGNITVLGGGTAGCGSSFQLLVEFSGTTTEVPVSGSGVHFTALKGTVNSDGTNYSPPAGGKDLITATYTNSNGSVRVSKVLVTGAPCI
jgi:hypothetical protein